VWIQDVTGENEAVTINWSYEKGGRRLNAEEGEGTGSTGKMESWKL